MMENGRDLQIGERALDLGRSVKNQAIILGGFVVLIWLLELLDWLIFDGSLTSFGIQPRSLVGLRGILFMPFLHSNFAHVLANTVPFIILGALVMLGGIPTFFIVAAIVMIVSGLGVWLLGPTNSVHIGASALIFGFFGFLLAKAYFERSIKAIILAVAVLAFYGGIFLGILPVRSGVSWQGHLFGFIGGVLAAFFISRGNRFR